MTNSGMKVFRFPAPACGGRRLHSTALSHAHEPSGVVRYAHSPNRGQARKLLNDDLPEGQEALKAATARPWVACGSRVSFCGPRKREKRGEPADKPGSVEDNHSSGTVVTGSLKRPTRKRRGPRHCFPIWSCSRWGLPSRSVLPPARCALTAPFHPYLTTHRG